MRTRPFVGAMIWICWRRAFIGMLSPTITLFGMSCFLSSRFSSRNRLASIAFLMSMSVLSIESGFSRKSYAPSLVARTAVSIVPCPEIMMTSGAFSFSRIFSRVSRPSIPGSHTSSSTTSNACLLMISRPASPLSAIEALNPSSSSTPLSDWRIVGSSSTMRMLCMLVDGSGDDRVRYNRQLHHEASPDRSIFFYANGAVVIFNNAIHDGKAQASASFLGGEVRQEQAFLQFPGNPVAGISHHNLHYVAVRYQSGGNLNFAKDGILHRFRRVVHQVGQRSLDGFGVGHHVGQLRRQKGAHADVVQTLVEHGQSAFHDGIDVRRLWPRRGETGQSGELIHQGADGFDRSGNGVSTAMEHLERSCVGRRGPLQVPTDAFC